jgi:hypothetical protein
MPTEQDIKNFTATVEDAVTYPILTRETSGYGSNGSSASTASGAGGGSQGKLAQQTIREVLGWRFRAGDTKGFLAALNKAFVLKEVEGHVEWDWKPQSYMLQADLGEITGAQASVHKQASVALEQAIPLLDGLKPLRTDADAEDTEAMRAIIRTELNELVNELALLGGPRVQRVDSFFEKLIGPLKTASFDPEHVAGQLARLRERFGLSRARVNTIIEEQNLTNFLILVDYVNSLYQSWNSKRGFFAGTLEPFLGTQLVLISQVLDAILEQLRETYDAMDSVFFGPAERQTTELNLPGGPMTVAEILSWVETFAAVEGRQLIQDAGKDGVVIFRSTIEQLATILKDAAKVAALPSTNPARPFHTKRVANALAELASYLTAATNRASRISRTPLRLAEEEGKEENLQFVATPVAPLPPAPPRVFKVDVIAHIRSGTAEKVVHQPGDKTMPGDILTAVASGLNLRSGSWDLGDGLELKDIQYDTSGQRVFMTLRVGTNAKPGARNLLIKDDYNRIFTLDNALTLDACASPALDPLDQADFEPRCGYQGQQKTIKFTGKKLVGTGVSFASGIRVLRTAYFGDGNNMNVDIDIGGTAEPGEHTVTLFTADCRSLELCGKFTVEKALPSPPATINIVQTSTPTCECAPPMPVEPCPPTTSYQGPSDQAAGLAAPPQTQDQSPPQHVQEICKAHGISPLKDYSVHSWKEPCELKRKGCKVVIDLQPGQSVKQAYLVLKSDPQKTIKSTDLQQQGTRLTMLFDPSSAPAGEYGLVKIMNDDSVEYVPSAGILK